MWKYLLRKLGYSFLILIGVIAIIFLLFNSIPADSARMTLGQRADVSTVENIRKEFRLNLPLPQRMWYYLCDLSPISLNERENKEHPLFLNTENYTYVKLLDLGSKSLVLKKPYLGRSYQNKRKVDEIILQKIPNTCMLAVSAMFIASVLGISLGLVAALKKNSWIDNAISVFATIGISVPSFLSAMIFSLIFAGWLHDYTGLNLTGSFFDSDDLGDPMISFRNLLLPSLALGLRPVAIIAQLTRSSMLDVLSQDYVRTAKAKGLSTAVVNIKHALRNALNPVVTAISGWFADLLAGAFFIEFVFHYNGLGLKTVDALNSFDFPVVMASVIFTASIFILTNILVDFLYSILDPRVVVK